MNLRKQDLIKIIKEEMSAIIGEGGMKGMAMEIMDELQILMTKYSIDAGGLQGILSDMSEMQSGDEDGEWTKTPYGAYRPIKEPTMKEGNGHDGDMSMTNRLARAMLDTLTADVELPEEEKEHYMITLQDVAQEVLMPMWSEMQQHHNAVTNAPIQGGDDMPQHNDEQDDMQRRFESKKRKRKSLKVK